MIDWNTVIYDDCLNEVNGLQTLSDKSFDLGYTDPPWGVNVDKVLSKDRKYVHGRVLKSSKKRGKVNYKDKFDPEWNLKWFTELDRICNSIILLIPEKPQIKKWWWSNTDPIGDITIHWSNGHSRYGKVAKFSHKSTYLVYGKLRNKLLNDILVNQTMVWGFLSKWKGKHPSRKGIEIISQIISQIKPESVIDPFLGSGSFAQACYLLGIKWFGYEINPIYKSDIDDGLRDIENELNQRRMF